MSPAVENTLSDPIEVAGIHKIFLAKVAQVTLCKSLQNIVPESIFAKQYRDRYCSQQNPDSPIISHGTTPEPIETWHIAWVIGI